MKAEPIRLVLTEDQSAFLRETGSSFLILSPGSYPASGGRMVLNLIPCDRTIAIAACETAQGLRKPGRKIEVVTTPVPVSPGSGNHM